MALFEAKDLHLRFGDRVVLENVSLAFEAGQLSGIMGPNGAGKTTCFNVLTGRYKPDRGQVMWQGQDITGRSPQAIARLGIARSFQLMNLFDEFTVFENIAIALPKTRARARNMVAQAYADPALVDKAHVILKRVGLAERAGDEAKSLPYGARRALEIGVALACRPRLLFLDEPTAGLGSDGRARLADQISVIHWGQVIAKGTPASLKTNPWVEASNLGRLN